MASDGPPSFEKTQRYTVRDYSWTIPWHSTRTRGSYMPSSCLPYEVSSLTASNGADETAPLHVELTATPDLPLDTATLARLRWANEQFDAWEDHWDQVLIARGENASFIRESRELLPVQMIADPTVTMQRQLAELLLNSQLLRGVKSAADVEAMATEKRALALRAMRNALSCVDICLRGRFVSHAWILAAGIVRLTHSTQQDSCTAHTSRKCLSRLRRRSSSVSPVTSRTSSTCGVSRRTSRRLPLSWLGVSHICVPSSE